MRTIIGIDVGTTHIKSVLFDEAGNALREEKVRTPLTSDGYGSVYRPEKIWSIVSGQLLALIESAGSEPSGISITGMAEAGLIVDKKTRGEECAILPWFDRRTVSLAEKTGTEEEREIFARTGLRNSFKYGIYKFLWQLSETKADKKTAVWLSMCDYIAFKLTGSLVTEPGFAARTWVYDIREGRWDVRRLQSLGLGEENFPTVLPSGSVCGVYRTPSGKEIPVALAGHDHICAAFGLLYRDREGICDSAGTSETYVARLAPGTVFREDSGLLYGPFADGGYYCMANVPSSGHSVEWFLKKLQLKGVSYEEMNEALLRTAGEPTGLLFFPYLTGMGGPWYEAKMKGTLMGLSEDTDGWTVLKAILEGIQYQAAWLLDLMEEKHGARCGRVICAGGSANNRAMMQLKADILGKTVLVPAMREATLAGAAALFWHRNKESAAAARFLENSLKYKDSYTPDKESSLKFRRLLAERYLPMVELLGTFYKQ